PNQASVSTPAHLAPRMCRSTNSRRVAQPEVWFRIRHIAEDGHHGPLGDAYRDQTVEVTLGPKGAFNKGNLGVLTRRVATDRVVRALPEPRGKPKPLRKPETPRVVELLRTAMEWERQLDAGEVGTQAEIAGRERITRARVTQIMALLRLAPEIRDQILAMPESVGQPAISERALRPIAPIKDAEQQLAEFQNLPKVGSS
ncbi:MAG: hypothetical protein JXB46_07730, partial [Candidatus Eisenbacteria bacterium]|nr:hypothetical protein [Candidatus Eisenbacteria bacterium]